MSCSQAAGVLASVLHILVSILPKKSGSMVNSHKVPV